MAEAEGVELLGEGLAKDAVREAYAGEISGNLALEVDPEVWVVVLRFAADEMEDGHAVVGRAEKKRLAEVGEQRKVEGGRRGASEADGAAGVGGERGLEVVGENAESDFEFLGLGVVIGFGETGADRMGRGVGCGRKKIKADDQRKRGQGEAT